MRAGNREGTEVESKCTTGRWTHKSIRALLANPRYRSWWEYSATESVWQNKKDYSRQVPRSEPLNTAQFEHLRIVTDTLWYQAQDRLAQADHAGAGRKSKDGDRQTRPRLLNGLFVCPEHHQIMYVGGSFGHLMFCLACQSMPKHKRPLYSQLNRQVALRLTCAKLADLVQQDETLVQSIIKAVQREAMALQRPDPGQLKALQTKRDGITRHIQFVMDNLGETDVDHREAEVKLKQLRHERTGVLAEIHKLEDASTRTILIPSEADVHSLLDRLGSCLRTAAQGDVEVDQTDARRIVDLLTGGCIELFQQGERKAQRGWLQGRFQVRLVSGLVELLIGTTSQADGPLVTIDYYEPTTSELYADPVKQLCDEGKLINVIAAELGISPYLATKALDHWYEHRGLCKLDGRTRRASLAQQHLEDPLYLRIVDQAMQLYSEGLSIQEIATQLQCDRNTVSKAIKYGHKVRGLPLMDGRSRRKHLRQSRSKSCEANSEYSVSSSPVVS